MSMGHIGTVSSTLAIAYPVYEIHGAGMTGLVPVLRRGGSNGAHGPSFSPPVLCQVMPEGHGRRVDLAARVVRTSLLRAGQGSES